MKKLSLLEALEKFYKTKTRIEKEKREHTKSRRSTNQNLSEGKLSVEKTPGYSIEARDF